MLSLQKTGVVWDACVVLFSSQKTTLGLALGTTQVKFGVDFLGGFASSNPQMKSLRCQKGFDLPKNVPEVARENLLLQSAKA